MVVNKNKLTTHCVKHSCATIDVEASNEVCIITQSVQKHISIIPTARSILDKSLQVVNFNGSPFEYICIRPTSNIIIRENRATRIVRTGNTACGLTANDQSSYRSLQTFVTDVRLVRARGGRGQLWKVFRIPHTYNAFFVGFRSTE